MPTFDQSVNTRLTTDGDLLTRTAGLPARVTRAALAADPAFTGAFARIVGVAAATGVAATDTASLQAALDAAAAFSPSGGVVEFVGGYVTNAPLTLPAGVSLQGNRRYGASITNTTTDVFSIASHIDNVEYLGFSVTASGGHIFTVTSAGALSRSTMRGLILTQQSTTKRIWNQTNASAYIDNLVEQCELTMASAASVVPWYLVSNAVGINSNTWRNLRVNGANNVLGTRFFFIEEQAASNAAWDNRFEAVTVELCDSGFIEANSVRNIVFENVACWDVTTYASSLFKIGKHASALASGGVRAKNSGRRGGALAGGAYDFEAASTTNDIILDCVGPTTGLPTYSVPTGTTVVTGTGVVGGALASGYETTGNRPNATYYQPSSRVYDSTLKKPFYTDGTNWYDALGPDPAWTAVSGGVGFQNSWANAGGGNANAQFRISPDGRHVEVVGVIITGTSGTVAFTLPAGYRPTTQKTASTVNLTTAGTVGIVVGTGGAVTVYGGAAGDGRSIDFTFPLGV